MALILLTLIGCLTGWFASIVMRSEEGRTILQDMGVGLVGSLAAGLVASNFTLLGGLRLTSIFAALAGATIAVAAVYFYRKRKTQD